MKKIYYLSTCDTCKKIMKDLAISELPEFIIQDIKTERITPDQLDAMKEMSGSYEALFSRRAIKYKTFGLKDKKLTEKEYRTYILSEYSFLKRPIVIFKENIFVGNDKKTLERLNQAIIHV